MNEHLVTKLFKIMEDVDRVGRDTTVNTRSGSYKGVSHDKVNENIRPLLIQNKVLVKASVIKSSFIESSNMAIADVEVTFIDVEHPDERETVTMFGFGLDTQDKGPGKAISYAVKYALLKTFAMQTGDDPENDSIEREELRQAKEAIAPRKPEASELQVLQLKAKQLVSKIGGWGRFVEQATADVPVQGANGQYTVEDYKTIIAIAEEVLGKPSKSSH